MDTIKVGDNGPDIVRLQKKLESHGYKLPKYGADGWAGLETLRAALRFVRDRKLPWKNYKRYTEIPVSVCMFIMDEPFEEQPSRGMVDVTDKHPLYNGYRTLRDLKKITAAVLHQTSCHLGTKPERWYTLGAHFGLPPDGNIFYINKLNVVMWHANWFNKFSVGIEIDGNFQGLEGRDNTRWTPGGRKSSLTSAQIVAAKETIIWICKEVEKHGGRITDILAHRQTSKNRVNDPGSAIWKEIGLWAQKELGLNNEPLYTKGSGLTIPEEWDHRAVHDFYGHLTDRAVMWYQRALNEFLRKALDDGLKRTSLLLKPDGDHGRLTNKTLRFFQSKVGIKVTGKVKASDRNYLERLLTPPTLVEWQRYLEGRDD